MKPKYDREIRIILVLSGVLTFLFIGLNMSLPALFFMSVFPISNIFYAMHKEGRLWDSSQDS